MVVELNIIILYHLVGITFIKFLRIRDTQKVIKFCVGIVIVLEDSMVFVHINYNFL
jgi:hypothetical protein